jgi:hypothetical protein
MIGALIRLDPAMRTLRGSLALTVAFGLFLGALLSRHPGWFEERFLGDDPGMSMFIFAHVWLILLLFMILSHMTVHSARINLVLPLPTRKVWLARITAILAAGLLPLCVLTLVLSLHPWVFNGGFGIDTRVLRLGAMMGLGLALTALLYQTPSPALASIRLGPAYILYAAIVSCGVPTAILLAPRSFALAAAMASATLILGIRIYLSLPPVLSLGPSETSKEKERDRRASAAASKQPSSRTAWPSAAESVYPGSRRFRWLLHLTAFRVLANHPLAWIIFPVAAFYGYTMARSYYRGADLKPYFLISLIWLVAMLFQGIIRMHKLDPFPISRRLLFAYSILPIVLVMGVGAGAGQLHFVLKQHQFKMIRCYHPNEPNGAFSIGVPTDCWEIAWDGSAPAVTSPWGESHVPEALRPWKGSDAAVYNPYEVGEESSDEFIEFQLNRAIEKIYGVPAPEYGATPTVAGDGDPQEPGEAGRATPAAGRNEVLHEPEGARRTDSASRGYEEPGEPAKRGEPAVVWPENRGSRFRNRTMATRVLLLGLITTVIVCLGLQQFRATTPEAVYPWLLQGMAVPVIVVIGGVYLADQLGYADFRAVAAFPEILVGKLGESLPLSTPAIWGLAIATLGIGYRVIQSRFRKIEAPLQHKKKLSEY